MVTWSYLSCFLKDQMKSLDFLGTQSDMTRWSWKPSEGEPSALGSWMASLFENLLISWDAIFLSGPVIAEDIWRSMKVWSQWFVLISIGGFRKWGYPLVIHLWKDFPWNKPSSYWGTSIYGNPQLDPIGWSMFDVCFWTIFDPLRHLQKQKILGLCPGCETSPDRWVNIFIDPRYP